MFSRSDHHNPVAPLKVPAPPTAHSTPGWPPPGDHTTAHHQRLESLLDSALATLTLILDIAATPTYTDHPTDVIHALYQRMTAASPSPTPTPTPRNHSPTLPNPASPP